MSSLNKYDGSNENPAFPEEFHSSMHRAGAALRIPSRSAVRSFSTERYPVHLDLEVLQRWKMVKCFTFGKTSRENKTGRLAPLICGHLIRGQLYIHLLTSNHGPSETEGRSWWDVCEVVGLCQTAVSQSYRQPETVHEVFT